MKIVGANSEAEVTGLEQLPGKVNYFVGNEPANWQTNIPTYAKVEYRDVYPGVNLFYYGNQGHLEYDFVVFPGSDPSVIQLAFEGTENIEVDSQGDLILRTAQGYLTMHKPLVYQEVAGIKKPIAAAYVLNPLSQNRDSVAKGDDQNGLSISMQVASYNFTRPLVIDPMLILSTYLGGSGNDEGRSIAIHPNTGDVYVTGTTPSTNFPGAAGGAQDAIAGFLQDAFVTRLDSDLTTLTESTYLGGNNADTASSIAIHPISGDVYIGGITESTNFPGVAGGAQSAIGGIGFRDAFVARLSGDLTTLIQSTYLGGSGGDDGQYLVIHPATGDVYIAGETRSANFPGTAGGAQTVRRSIDSFVSRLSSDVTTLIQSTYLGGTHLEDFGVALAVHPTTGEIYITGRTFSTNFVSAGFPGTAGGAQAAYGGGHTDAFVARLSRDLTTLIQATYLGGTANDRSVAVAVHPITGEIYVGGHTESTNFPAAAGGAQPSFGGIGTSFFGDAFVARLNSALTAVLQSTYMGGSGSDMASGIAIDPTTGDVHIAGETQSTDFPGRVGGAQTDLSGISDAFVARFSSDLKTLIYSSYVGGASNDLARALALHPVTGEIYISGETASTDFPGTTGGAQQISGGSTDVFVALISANSAAPALV
jgi:hypothetical protein